MLSMSFNSIVDHHLSNDGKKGIILIDAFNSIVDHLDIIVERYAEPPRLYTFNSIVDHQRLDRIEKAIAKTTFNSIVDHPEFPENGNCQNS